MFILIPCSENSWLEANIRRSIRSLNYMSHFHNCRSAKPLYGSITCRVITDILLQCNWCIGYDEAIKTNIHWRHFYNFFLTLSFQDSKYCTNTFNFKIMCYELSTPENNMTSCSSYHAFLKVWEALGVQQIIPITPKVMSITLEFSAYGYTLRTRSHFILLHDKCDNHMI
jgi:hypothetical protein